MGENWVDESLSVDIARDGEGTLVLSLAGEIDLTNIERCAKAMSDVASRVDGDEKFVLDLTGVDYMGSAGISIIHSHVDRIARMVVSPALKSIVVLCGLTELVKIEYSN